MINSRIFLGLLIASWLLFTTGAMGNPFSCRLNNEKQAQSTETHVNVNLTYKGYAIIKEHIFAIIQIGSEQYAVKKMDRIKGALVLEISPESLVYSQNQQTFRVKLESHDFTPNLNDYF